MRAQLIRVGAMLSVLATFIVLALAAGAGVRGW